MVYDAGKIFPALMVFFVFVTFPFLTSGGKAPKGPDLKLDTPTIAKLKEKSCIESKAWMRRNHMRLLGSWRREKVREGKAFYTNSRGRSYRIDLTLGCLNCHSNKKDFCDRCHTYSSVSIRCFACHVEPKEVRKWTRAAGRS